MFQIIPFFGNRLISSLCTPLGKNKAWCYIILKILSGFRNKTKAISFPRKITLESVCQSQSLKTGKVSEKTRQPEFLKENMIKISNKYETEFIDNVYHYYREYCVETKTNNFNIRWAFSIIVIIFIWKFSASERPVCLLFSAGVSAPIRRGNI